MAMQPETLYDKDYKLNPAPVWEQMRHDHPLFYDQIGDVYWLTRYHDVGAVFADHTTYSASTYELRTGEVLGPTLISRDDHGHTVRRAIVAPDFVGKRLLAYRDMISSCANDLIDRFADAGSVRLVDQFSARLPVDVISGMLGMVGDGDLFRQWVTDMIMGLAPGTELRQKGLEAHAAFCSHIAPALQNVEDPARTDHIAKIARAEVEGHRLDEKEITAFCGLLFIAGGETTDKAIGNMWFNLITNPGLMAEVERDRSLWDNAFSETMRHTSPVTTEDRFTTTPVEWYGTDIPVGARVRVSMAAAHRDDSVFQDPDTFDLHRPDLHLTKELRSGKASEPDRSGHMGFGLGKHFCIGYELARTEAVIGSNLLLDRCGHFELAAGAEPYVSMSNAFQATFGLDLVFS